MKTFPITIENLKFRHVGRGLGVLLGLVLITFVLSAIGLGISVVGAKEFYRIHTISSAFIALAFITFGGLLLLPRSRIRSHSLCFSAFLITASVFLFKSVSSLYESFKPSSASHFFPWWSVFLASVVLVGIWNTVGLIRTRREQAGAGQPATRPVDKPEGSEKPQPEAEGRSR